MRVWTGNGWVLRQGNAITMALWLVSLLVHFVGDNGQSHAGAAGLEGASFLLYLGVTLCVQYYVVYRRALPLWAELGPDAGRPLAVQFMQFTQHPGAFFASFNGPAGWARGARSGPARAGQRAIRSGRAEPLTPTIPTSSTPRWSRTTTTTGRPSCTHPADGFLHSAPVTSTPSTSASTRSFSQRPYVGPPGSTELWLVRHGASADSLEGETFELVEGQGDPPLSEAGRHQAEQVGLRLAQEPFDALYVTHPAAHGPDGGAAGGPQRHDGRSSRPICARCSSASGRAAFCG